MSSNCVIYLRVSSQKQVREGDGLNSQLYQCQEYSKFKQYKVLSIFQDDGISGSKKDRAGLQSMFDFLADKPNTKIVVYDSKRFARAEPLIYYQLMDVVKQLKCRLEYVTMQVEDNPIGRFMEGLSGLQANLEREQNAEQVKSRMVARLKSGYWVFAKKAGYKYVTSAGRCLVPNQPFFDILKNSILGYLYNDFATQIEAYNSAKNQGLILHYANFCRIFKDPFFAGVIHYPEWGCVWMFKDSEGKNIAKHRPMLTLEQFDLLQIKLDGRNIKTPRLQDMTDHFPFKNHLFCAECNNFLTGYYSTRARKDGTKATYPYYACHHRGCSEYKLGMPREQVNQIIDEQIAKAQPKPLLIESMKLILDSLSDTDQKTNENSKEALELKLKIVESDIDTLINRIAKTKIDTIAETLESRVLGLEIERNLILEKLDGENDEEVLDVRTAQNKVLELASNLSSLFTRADNSTKKNILEVVFEDGLKIKREKIVGKIGKYKLFVRTPESGLFYTLSSPSINTDSEWWSIRYHNRTPDFMSIWQDRTTLSRASRLIDKIMA
jgi:site-specific DNA recombinase